MLMMSPASPTRSVSHGYKNSEKQSVETYTQDGRDDKTCDSGRYGRGARECPGSGTVEVTGAVREGKSPWKASWKRGQWFGSSFQPPHLGPLGARRVAQFQIFPVKHEDCRKL